MPFSRHACQIKMRGDIFAMSLQTRQSSPMVARWRLAGYRRHQEENARRAPRRIREWRHAASRECRRFRPPDRQQAAMPLPLIRPPLPPTPPPRMTMSRRYAARNSLRCRHAIRCRDGEPVADRTCPPLAPDTTRAKSWMLTRRHSPLMAMMPRYAAPRA